MYILKRYPHGAIESYHCSFVAAKVAQLKLALRGIFNLKIVEG